MSATAPNPPDPWYETDPARLAWELEQFAARGLSASMRLAAPPASLVVETELTYRGAPVRIWVAFPFDYPEMGPMVYGPPGLLDRHQQPVDGNFCWAEDPDREWWPGMDAAQLVAEDVRWLLKDSERGMKSVHAGEADMPEPVSGLVHFRDGAVIVPEPYFEPELPVADGTMALVGSGSPYFLARAAGLGTVDESLREYCAKDAHAQPGFWVDVSPTPSATEFDTELLALIETSCPRVFAHLQRRLRKVKAKGMAASAWVGVTFMEEGPRRGELRRNWLFARVQLARDGSRTVEEQLGAQALTLSERQRRTPELIGLADGKVLVIGAGSLGGPLTFELVKAGVGQLDVVDPDRFDVNNSVRHVLGINAAGLNKAVAVSVYAGQLNPFVAVTAHARLTVGGGASDGAQLASLVSQASVVVDTTGAPPVARILQRHCRQHAKTLVVAGLSAGSYGGEVAVFRPGGACFECLVLAQRDGLVPEPLAAPRSSLVTPVGCSHPAFAGAGFDATELAAVAARTAVQATAISSYPSLKFDWAVANFRDGERWTQGDLQTHPDCPYCR